VPIVLFEHNVEHMIWRRIADLERTWWRRAVLEVEARKVRRPSAADAPPRISSSPCPRTIAFV
jgi:hypothetical protein